MLLPAPALRRALLSRPWTGAGLRWKHTSSLKVANEPVLAFTQGSPERDALQKALKDLKGRMEAIPCVVGDEEVWTSDVQYQVSPFNHGHKVAKFCYADKSLLNKAIEAALAARKEWDLKPIADRAQIFLKAADMLSGPRRAEILAKTMVGQGKTVIQAEIDAAAELIDFFRFNAKYAVELEGQQPISVPPSTNSTVYRGLEGFVAAISPFNFTAIGGNLAGAPALMHLQTPVEAGGPEPGPVPHLPTPGWRVRRKELPLRAPLGRRGERGERDPPLSLRVRWPEVFRVLASLRAALAVAADQRAAAGGAQSDQSGRPCRGFWDLLLCSD